MIPVFDNTTEGRLGESIMKYIKKHPRCQHYEQAIRQSKERLDSLRDTLYQEMDADNWLRLNGDEQDTFLQICGYNPKTIFSIAFELASLGIKCETLPGNNTGLVTILYE